VWWKRYSSLESSQHNNDEKANFKKRLNHFKHLQFKIWTVADSQPTHEFEKNTTPDEKQTTQHANISSSWEEIQTPAVIADAGSRIILEDKNIQKSSAAWDGRHFQRLESFTI
jgi:hypothetical protein